MTANPSELLATIGQIDNPPAGGSSGTQAYFLASLIYLMFLAGLLFAYAHLAHYTQLRYLRKLEGEINNLLRGEKVWFSWFRKHREELISRTNPGDALRIITATSAVLFIGVLPMFFVFAIVVANLFLILGKGYAAILAVFVVLYFVIAIIGVFRRRETIAKQIGS